MIINKILSSFKSDRKTSRVIGKNRSWIWCHLTQKRKKKKNVHRPGIEPGSPAWQADILPLDHRCFWRTLSYIHSYFYIQFFLLCLSNCTLIPFPFILFLSKFLKSVNVILSISSKKHFFQFERKSVFPSAY